MFSLQRLLQSLAIVNREGLPTPQYMRLWNDTMKAIEERAENEAETDAAIQALLVTIQAQQTELEAAILAVQAAQEAAQAAQQSANAPAGGGAVTGSVTGICSPVLGVWVEAALVSLTGVSASTLTMGGTGPIQTSDIVKTAAGPAPGLFRLVEVVSGVDTVLFTGNYNVTSSGEYDVPPYVANNSSAAVTAFSSARSSTGAVDYRVDVQQTSGSPVFDLSFYLYVRR